MKNLLQVGPRAGLRSRLDPAVPRPLLVTRNLILAVALGMALGVVQIGWLMVRRQPIGSLQLLSIVLILASGAATLFTHDPTFVMLKPRSSTASSAPICCGAAG